MNLDDGFKPYSPEMGDLEGYLEKTNMGGSMDNHFYGVEYFLVIKEKGFLLPGATGVRVAVECGPDNVYFVNEDFMLESHGVGEHNMSSVGAEKGIYNPEKILKDAHWSIHYLKLWD